MAVDSSQKVFVSIVKDKDGEGSVSVERRYDGDRIYLDISIVPEDGYVLDYNEFSSSPDETTNNLLVHSSDLAAAYKNETSFSIAANTTTIYGSLYVECTVTITVHFRKIQNGILYSPSKGGLIICSSGGIPMCVWSNSV